ncbi:MAG: alkaline phosphatase family protein [Thermoanaerobaculia bacterium]|nr:alkaline phosphatase family protein [Thermoanaerobaculia bacterium]
MDRGGVLTRSGRRQLLMLGLDGADLDLIRGWSDRLPTLGRALTDWQRYEPAAPAALSGSVWPTFYNGAHPGIHGVYQHLVWDPERMGLRRIGPDWCHYRPFWADLEAEGHEMVVLDVPYSFPTSLRRGAEITDWATHGQTWPLGCTSATARRALRRVGRSPMGRETPVRKSPRQLERIRRAMIASAAAKGRLVRELMRELPWDGFIAVFGETHRGGHTLWGREGSGRGGEGDEALLDVYRAVDEAVGAILADVDPSRTSRVIFSVHGMAADYAQGHFVPALMRRINDRFADRESTGGRRRSAGLVALARRLTPARLQHAVGAALPDSARQWVVEREIVGGIDWSRTPGFALRTDIRTELRLNLAGREAKGVLPRDGDLRDAYVELIRAALLPLVDADTGARLIADVVDIGARFPGPRSDRLPDLVVTWRPQPAARRVHSPLLGTLEADPPGARGGDHTDTGFALVSDPAARSLPPLRETADFAAVAKCLVRTEEAKDRRTA